MLMGEGNYHTYHTVEKYGLHWRWGDAAGERADLPDGRVSEAYIQCEDAVEEDWLLVIDGILPAGTKGAQAFSNGKRIGKPLEEIAVGYRWMILEDNKEDTPIAKGETLTLDHAQQTIAIVYDAKRKRPEKKDAMENVTNLQELKDTLEVVQEAIFDSQERTYAESLQKRLESQENPITVACDVLRWYAGIEFTPAELEKWYPQR